MPKERIVLLDPNNSVLGTETVSAKQVLQVSVVKTVGGGGGGGGDVNLASVGGSAITIGSALSAASLPVVIASDQSNLPINIVRVGGSALSLGQQLAGASLPIILTADQLTTLTPPTSVTVTQATAANLNATVVGTGTFAVQAAQSGSWAVTANAGTNLNTSALALDTSVNGILLAQGSTTSSQLGPLIQGAVTSSKPTYLNLKTNPLSLDTSGLLRISLADTPANSNKFLVTADPITFASAQPVTQSGVWSTRTQDGSGNAITSTGNALDVNLKTSSITLTVSGSVSVSNFPATQSVTQSTSPWIVAGNKTNNNAAPGATNIGTLPAIANAAAQSWTEGDQVGLSVDLSGNLRTSSTFTPSGTQNVNLQQVGGVTTDIGLGVAGSGTQRVAVSSDSTITASVSFTALQNQNLMIIEILAELLREMRATRYAMSAWTSEAVAGYNFVDFDPHNIQKQLE